MTASYARHLFNGLDVKYPTPYIRDLDNTSTALSLLQYTLLFLALARLAGAPRPPCARWRSLVGDGRARQRDARRDRSTGRAALLPTVDSARLPARLLRPGHPRDAARRKQEPPRSACRLVCRLPPRLPDALVVRPRTRSSFRRPSDAAIYTERRSCRRPRAARCHRRRSMSRRATTARSRSRSSFPSTTKRRTSTSSTRS